MGGIFHANADVLVVAGNEAIGHMLGFVFGQVVAVEFHNFIATAH
jgi:uncharacterized membrane protein required for colicin V production